MNITPQKIQVTRLALGLSGLPCNDAQAETILMVLDSMERLGKKFSLSDACDIESYITKK